MRKEVKEIITKYLHLDEGNKTAEDLLKLLLPVGLELLHDNTDEEKVKLTYIKYKLKIGLEGAKIHGTFYLDITDTEESLDRVYQDWKEGKKEDWTKDEILGAKRKRPKKKKEDLGRITDTGETPYGSRTDDYWHNKERMKLAFQPDNKEVRSGPDIPKGYGYENEEFLTAYYDLKSISFGNWLSQKDCMNYVAALGIALFDLHQVLSFSPHQISLGGKLSVAFGARGRGNAVAHFEESTYVINVTRYKRPPKGSAKEKGFSRIKLLLASGGMGSFAHEFAHALDYYAGTFIKHSPKNALSNGQSTRVQSHKAIMKEDNVAGYMERLLQKIIWKNEEKKEYSAYYQRIKKGIASKDLTPYYSFRNELFARAFESYIHYKMSQRKHYNIFLAETKYNPDTYLTPKEIKPLVKDMDQLVNGIRRKIKIEK